MTLKVEACIFIYRKEYMTIVALSIGSLTATRDYTYDLGRYKTSAKRKSLFNYHVGKGA